MDRLRVRLWRLIYPPPKVKEKTQRLATKRVVRLLNGASGGGTEAMTFGEKVAVCLLLLLMLGFTVGLMVAVIVASSQQ